MQLGLFTVLVAKSANLRIFWCRGLRAYERDFIGVVGLRLYEIDFIGVEDYVSTKKILFMT